MTMLTAAPKKWYSWDFVVARHDARAEASALRSDNAPTVAHIDLSAWRETGVLNVEGINYRVYRESAMGDFVLTRDGAVLARATRPSAFRRSFTLDHNGRQYTLRAKAPFRRAFVLLDGTREIGSLVPDSAWTRKSTVHLPDGWPLPLTVYAIWLTIILWKRDSDGAAAA